MPTLNPEETQRLRDSIRGSIRTADGLLELAQSPELAHSIVRNLQVALSRTLELERELAGIPGPVHSRD